MNKMILRILVGVALSMIFVVSVQAASITGSIGFTGTYTQNGGTNGVLNTATSMTISTPSIVISPTSGSFVGATLVTFASPIGVNVNSSDLVGNTFWSVLVGSTTYTFKVTTESQTFTSGTQLNLAGLGTITDGTNTVSGTWQIGFGVSGSSFTFQSTSAATPEPSSLYLLGMGILGLFGYGLKRRG
jgi:hypothetical protein